jgi:hypothetical protein
MIAISELLEHLAYNRIHNSVHGRQMKSQETDILTSLSQVSHEQFNIKEYKSTFIKTFLHVCQSQCKSSLDRKDAAGLALILYNTLFINRPTTVDPVLTEITKTLKAPSTVSGFLSAVFFIFIHHYSKTFFGKTKGWKKFIRTTRALDALINFSAKIDHDFASGPPNLPPDDLAISALEEVRRNNGYILVLNTYRSVPIQYKAKVVHTGAESVLIKTHALQEIAASFQGGIYILKNDQFDFDLYASVKRRVVKGHDLLELSRFDQLTTSFHKRQTVRVHPMETFMLTLQHNNQSYVVTLFDISIGGLAVISNRELPLVLSDPVVIRLPASLLEAETDMELESSLIHHSVFERGHKYHFQLTLDSTEENSISRLIVKRQNLIIKNLKEQMV